MPELIVHRKTEVPLQRILYVPMPFKLTPDQERVSALPATLSQRLPRTKRILSVGFSGILAGLRLFPEEPEGSYRVEFGFREGDIGARLSTALARVFRDSVASKILSGMPAITGPVPDGEAWLGPPIKVSSRYIASLEARVYRLAYECNELPMRRLP